MDFPRLALLPHAASRQEVVLGRKQVTQQPRQLSGGDAELLQSGTSGTARRRFDLNARTPVRLRGLREQYLKTKGIQGGLQKAPLLNGSTKHPCEQGKSTGRNLMGRCQLVSWKVQHVPTMHAGLQRQPQHGSEIHPGPILSSLKTTPKITSGQGGFQAAGCPQANYGANAVSEEKQEVKHNSTCPVQEEGLSKKDTTIISSGQRLFKVQSLARTSRCFFGIGIKATYGEMVENRLGQDSEMQEEEGLISKPGALLSQAVAGNGQDVQPVGEVSEEEERSDPCHSPFAIYPMARCQQRQEAQRAASGEEGLLLKLCGGRFKMDQRKSFFKQHNVKLWNLLPQDTVKAIRVDGFRQGGVWTSAQAKHEKKSADSGEGLRLMVARVQARVQGIEPRESNGFPPPKLVPHTSASHIPFMGNVFTVNTPSAMTRFKPILSLWKGRGLKLAAHGPIAGTGGAQGRGLWPSKCRRHPGRPPDERPPTTAVVESLMRPSLTQTLLPAAPRSAPCFNFHNGLASGPRANQQMELSTQKAFKHPPLESNKDLKRGSVGSSESLYQHTKLHEKGLLVQWAERSSNTVTDDWMPHCSRQPNRHQVNPNRMRMYSPD
ncbi:adenylate kinase [Varanus komodoensis]|nr:adenylate kinase [Varanus komodoensis]